MPVIRVMERKTTEKTRPALNTFSQVVGIQVSMDTTNAGQQHVPQHPDDPVHWGARTRGGGRRSGWIDRGQRVLGACPSLRSPGTTSRAATSTMKGSDVSTADDHTLLDRQVALQGGGHHAHQDAHQGGDGHGAQHRPRRGGEGGHHQGGVVLNWSSP